MIKNYHKDVLQWQEFPKSDIIWVDPPWQNKMVKWFQNKLQKDTGVIKTDTLEDIITHFAKVASKDIPIIMEYSIQEHEYIISIMESVGHTFIQKVEGIQSNGNPFILLNFNKYVKIDNTKSGKHIIINTLYGTEYNIVFDCFAGIGFTADAVKKAGKIYIGSELNEKRYERLCKINS